jgi:hypothetical protein
MVCAFLLVLAPFAAHAVSEADLLLPDEAFPLKVSLSGPQLTLDFGTKPGYYLYRDRFSFAVDGMSVKPAQMPPSESKAGCGPVVCLFVAARLAADGAGCVAAGRLRHDAARHRPIAAGRSWRLPHRQSIRRIDASRRNHRNWSALPSATLAW